MEELPNGVRKDLNQNFDKISRKLDILIIILLAKSGMKRKEIAKIIGVSERTINNMLPLRKLQQTGRVSDEET